MATNSVFLPGKSHGQRNVSGLQSTGLRRIRHDWMTSLIHFCKLRVSDLRIMQICLSSVQLLSRVWLFVIPWDCSTPGLPVHHQLPEFTQTHVHGVGDAIQPSHPLLSPSPTAFNFSQHHFKWVSSLQQVAKVLEFQLQDQSFQWIFRTDFL